ncbi:hypothetical protein LOAG_17194 [Loa loa]|uniref:Uncharacterized protein n=1 Tax=Loa loa TaxID=7209 RepID=A0A1S0UJL9_LOALO|nr:hypothetical protein LOAG_17194 [Loa loa]EJD75723.1 hypothetical protein LOAG_17194 [Loa loa]
MFSAFIHLLQRELKDGAWLGEVQAARTNGMAFNSVAGQNVVPGGQEFQIRTEAVNRLTTKRWS